MNAYPLTCQDDGLRVQGPDPLFSMRRARAEESGLDRAGERFLMKVEPEQSRQSTLRLHIDVFDEIDRRRRDGR